MRDFLKILLSREGYDVTLATSGENAFETLQKTRFDLVITDIKMKDVDGLEVLKKTKELSSESIVILISAFATAETAVQAMKEGAYDYIPKPFKVREFKRIIREALQSRRPPVSEEETGETKWPIHYGFLVGESAKMRKIYDLIQRVAQTRSNILISGESGTGKELAARAIHRQSARADKPFVVINCAGIPESLIESELFGYRKGAFTGAVSDKEGLFGVADNGTIFLDEVGELSPAIQVKLLRVIQERSFTAVGGTEEKSVDVRIISATNKDLEQEVIHKRFREDLFFRLNVIHIPMPAMRERDGDLPLLAQYFLDKYSRELNKDVRKISAYAMEVLGQYSFPGNVRELENIIERSVALETSSIVLPESLALSNFQKERVKDDRRQRDLTEKGLKLEEVMAELEREYLLRALDLSKGSKQKAAELLGITFESLRYRLAKLKLA